MKGRAHFTIEEANEIKRLLREKSVSDRSSQKSLRQRIRDIGFFISDWSSDPRGFTASDFDALVAAGAVTIEGIEPSLPPGIDFSILLDEPQKEEPQQVQRDLESNDDPREIAADASSEALGPDLEPFRRPWLVDFGFVGFVSFRELRNGGLDAVTTGPGVYVVLRESDAMPDFVEVGTGGQFKRKDPNVPIEALTSRWVKLEHVLYIGKATSLRKRLAQYVRFGAGQPIGHWGGRFVWQINDADSLLVAWKATPDRDPRDVERTLLSAFRERTGTRPFANLVD